MTWYIIFGLIIGIGIYLYYSSKNKKVYMQSASDQNVHDHNSDHNSSEHNRTGHDHKKGHGCC